MRTVTTLLAELASCGIHLLRDGDALRVEVPAGVTLDPYRERIARHKTAILVDLLEREAIADLTDQLEVGWHWLDEHPHHPAHAAFLSRWLNRLSTYEQTYAAHHEQGEASCRAS